MYTRGYDVLTNALFSWTRAHISELRTLSRTIGKSIIKTKSTCEVFSLPVQHFLSESQREAAEKTRHLSYSLHRRPAANEKDNLVLSTELIM